MFLIRFVITSLISSILPQSVMSFGFRFFSFLYMRDRLTCMFWPVLFCLSVFQSCIVVLGMLSSLLSCLSVLFFSSVVIISCLSFGCSFVIVSRISAFLYMVVLLISSSTHQSCL